MIEGGPETAINDYLTRFLLAISAMPWRSGSGTRT